MNKKICCFLITLLIIIPFNVNALMETEAKDTIDSFFYYFNSNDSKIDNYIDTSNKDLYNNIHNYMGNASANHKIQNITANEDGSYNVTCIINAEGSDDGNWNVNGVKVNFKVSSINDKNLIESTNFFDNIGSKSVIKIVSKVFIIILSIIGGSFLIILLVVLIILLVNKHKKKAN